MIETTSTHALVCCFRLLPLSCGAEIDQSYSAQFYGLTPLRDYPGRMVEVGRFCVDPAYRDPDILRLAWAALTRFVDAEEIEMLFGCSSFQGTETAQYLDAFAMLKEHHLAPERWQPRVKAPDVFRFARRLRRKADPKAAARAMPPLLRSYLAMGGLGQRSRGGGPGSGHAPCLHRARGPHHPSYARTSLAGSGLT